MSLFGRLAQENGDLGPSPGHARAIRGWLTESFGDEKAEGVAILYGGSCKPSNAAELFGQPTSTAA